MVEKLYPIVFQQEVHMIDINKFLQVLSEIFSDRLGVQVTFTATRKEEVKQG
jgi:spore germination protein GerM